MNASSGPPLEIRVLGELELLRQGEPLVLPASKKTRALLGYLVVVAGPHARQRLCDLFWDGPDDPRAELRWSLTKLRPLLDEANVRRLSADREHVSFALKGAGLDLAAVRDETAHLETVSVETLRQAAGRFRGELLEGLDLPGCYRYHEWCVAEREAARRVRVEILGTLAERLAGQPEEALVYTRLRVAIDPLAEEGHIAVIKLLDRLGRTRDAVKQYDSCRRQLEAQLGRRPSGALEAVRSALGQGTAKQGPSAPPPEPGPPSTVRSPIVGRTSERATIARLADDAAAGCCDSVLLLTGEPGIGKTRLLKEAADQIVQRGGGVLAGRAFEAEMVRAYGPWIDALRSARLGAFDEAVRAGLAPLLPELGVTVDVDRNRLFDAVTRLLALRAASTPLLVALDDVQWFDEASLALLHYVARSLSGSRVLIACAGRTGEIDANARVQGLLRGMARDRRLIHVEIGPLDAAATTELVKSVDTRLDAARVFADGGGNPLFSLELARAGGRMGDDSVGHTLEGLIAERLSRLDDRAAELVPWTAALGRGFSIDTLAVLMSWPASDLLRAVEDLELHGVLCTSSSERGSVGYDYAHDLVRRAAYRAMSEPRRRWVHLHIARALAGASDREGSLAGEVAHHASLGGDSELSARAYVSAGERCLRMCAYAEAGQMAARGRQHVERLPRELGIELELALLSVYVHSNQWMRRTRDLEDDLGRLTREAERRGMHALVARGFYLVSYVQHERGEIAKAGETSWRAVNASRAADPNTQQLHLANTGRCLAQVETDLPQAEALLQEARARGGEGSARVWLEISTGLGLVHAFRGDNDAAKPLLERGVELATAVGEPWSQNCALARLAVMALEGGRQHEALERCDELEPIVAKFGEGSEAPFAATIRALARLALGVDGARAEVDRAIEALRAIDSQAHLAYALDTLAEWDERAGRVSEAHRAANEALGAAEKVGRRSEAAVARALLARLAIHRGARDEAIELLRACAPDIARPQGLSARACSALARAAECAGVSISALSA